MKLSQILVYLMTNISNMFFVKCSRRETSSRCFSDFNEMTISQDLSVVDICHFQFSLIHPFKKMKHWKLDIWHPLRSSLFVVEVSFNDTRTLDLYKFLWMCKFFILKSTPWAHSYWESMITKFELWKIICEGPNYREPRPINWKRCKVNIIDGLHSLTKGKMSPNRWNFFQRYILLCLSANLNIMLVS